MTDFYFDKRDLERSLQIANSLLHSLALLGRNHYMSDFKDDMLNDLSALARISDSLHEGDLVKASGIFSEEILNNELFDSFLENFVSQDDSEMNDVSFFFEFFSSYISEGSEENVLKIPETFQGQRVVEAENLACGKQQILLTDRGDDHPERFVVWRVVPEEEKIVSGIPKPSLFEAAALFEAFCGRKHKVSFDRERKS